jgi:PAS domain-containing protein
MMRARSGVCAIARRHELGKFGASATDFQPTTLPDDLESDIEHLQHMLADTLSRYDMEERYFHKSGKVLWMLLSVSLVRNTAGQPLYLVSKSWTSPNGGS